MTNALICYEKVVPVFVASVHIGDPLSVTNTDFRDFDDIIKIKRKSNEIYQSLEILFAAQVPRVHSHGSSIQLHQNILAIILLSGSNINEIERTPMLSVSATGLVIHP